MADRDRRRISRLSATVGLVFTRALLVAGATLAFVPASGHATKLSYHACDGKKYWLIDANGDPTVSVLRIKMRNAKADGYAPRCLVAEAVASAVQQRADDDGKLLKKVSAYGARWTAGTFRCTYTPMTGYTQAQCRHTGRDAATVRFRLTPKA